MSRLGGGRGGGNEHLKHSVKVKSILGESEFQLNLNMTKLKTNHLRFEAKGKVTQRAENLPG